MKKILTFLLCLLVAFVLMVACGFVNLLYEADQVEIANLTYVRMLLLFSVLLFVMVEMISRIKNLTARVEELEQRHVNEWKD